MRTLATLLLLCSSSVFAESADLLVVPVGFNPWSVTIALANGGPDVARDAVLTIEFPAVLTIERLSVLDAPCETTPGRVVCALGDLTVTNSPTNPPRYFGIDFKRPFVDGIHVITTSVTSGTPDPSPANNSGAVSFEFRVEADLAVFIFPDASRIDPGETLAFSSGVGNDTRVGENVSPRDIRVEYTATNAVIERIEAPSILSCSIDGATAVCTAPSLILEYDFESIRDIRVTLRASGDRRGDAAVLSMRASSNLPDFNDANSRTQSAVRVIRWIEVKTAADEGAGSLRDAMEQANATCTPGPCRIVFEIPGPVPAEGWFTITPSRPFPPLTSSRISIEGTRQTAFTGDTNPAGPEVAIDGRFAHHGLELLNRCESVVEGLAIGNFDANQAIRMTAPDSCPEFDRADRREIARNHIGVDPSGTVAWPNRRGISANDSGVLVSKNVISHNTYSGIWMMRGPIRIRENRFEHNGASGIFLGPQTTFAEVLENTIAEHREMGVAVARGAREIDIRQNAMKNNGGLGIDWGLDGVSPVDGDDSNFGASNAPVLLTARYIASEDRTVVNLVLKTSPLGPYMNGGSLDFYANEGPDGDGERWIGSHIHPDLSKPVVVSLFGDHRGKWINATWTRAYFDFAETPPGPKAEALFGGHSMTSELSNAVLVP